MSDALVAELARVGFLPLHRAGGELGAAGPLEQWLACWSELGLPIELDRHGLWWRPSDEPLSEAQITAMLAQVGWSVPVEVHVLLDSTNTRLLEASSAGGIAPRLCFAECQRAGRGRQQRRWLGRFGQGLLWSSLVSSSRSPAELPGLAIVVGVALAESLHGLGWHGIGLKWPNDLVAASGKLGGILVEACTGRTGTMAVVGMGLNLRPPPAMVEGVVREQPAAALLDLTRSGVAPLPGRNQLAARLAAAVLDSIAQFDREGLSPFLSRFAAHDVLAGRVVEYEQVGARFRGTALGLAEDGALRVQTRSGERRLYSADASARLV